MVADILMSLFVSIIINNFFCRIRTNSCENHYPSFRKILGLVDEIINGKCQKNRYKWTDSVLGFVLMNFARSNLQIFNFGIYLI